MTGIYCCLCVFTIHATLLYLLCGSDWRRCILLKRHTSTNTIDNFTVSQSVVAMSLQGSFPLQLCKRLMNMKMIETTISPTRGWVFKICSICTCDERLFSEGRIDLRQARERDVYSNWLLGRWVIRVIIEAFHELCAAATNQQGGEIAGIRKIIFISVWRSRVNIYKNAGAVRLRLLMDVRLAFALHKVDTDDRNFGVEIQCVGGREIN